MISVQNYEDVLTIIKYVNLKIISAMISVQNQSVNINFINPVIPIV